MTDHHDPAERLARVSPAEVLALASQLNRDHANRLLNELFDAEPGDERMAIDLFRASIRGLAKAELATGELADDLLVEVAKRVLEYQCYLARVEEQAPPRRLMDAVTALYGVDYELGEMLAGRADNASPEADLLPFLKKPEE